MCVVRQPRPEVTATVWHRRARKLLLNLADLTQINSSGTSIIVRTCVSHRRAYGDLRLLCPRGRVLEVLTVFPTGCYSQL